MKDEALKRALAVMRINLTLLEKVDPYDDQEDLLSDSLDLTHKAIATVKTALAQTAPDVDYWIREATKARQAEMALRRELEAQPAQRPWIWLSDADIAEVVDTTCQYTGSYEEYLIKKAEQKIRSMNNG